VPCRPPLRQEARPAANATAERANLLIVGRVGRCRRGPVEIATAAYFGRPFLWPLAQLLPLAERCGRVVRQALTALEALRAAPSDALNGRGRSGFSVVFNPAADNEGPGAGYRNNREHPRTRKLGPVSERATGVAV
jgi:hypothetical protein